MSERNWIDKLINIQAPDDQGDVNVRVDAGTDHDGDVRVDTGGSVTPPPAAPGGGSGGSGGQVVHTPSLIKQLGQKIAGIESILEKASSSLEGADISSDAFSGKGIVLANVYPGALDFGKNDVKTKITQLKNMSDGLVATAATWEQAEQASSVKTQ